MRPLQQRKKGFIAENVHSMTGTMVPLNLCSLWNNILISQNSYLTISHNKKLSTLSATLWLKFWSIGSEKLPNLTIEKPCEISHGKKVIKSWMQLQIGLDPKLLLLVCCLVQKWHVVSGTLEMAIVFLEFIWDWMHSYTIYSILYYWLYSNMTCECNWTKSASIIFK